MAKKKVTRKRRPKATEKAEEVSTPQEQPSPAPEEQLQPEIDKLSISADVETQPALDPGQTHVVLTCGDDTRTSTYENILVADAAEQLAATYVLSLQSFPAHDTPIMCKAITTDAVFGPFIVDCSLVVEAKSLRGMN